MRTTFSHPAAIEPRMDRMNGRNPGQKPRPMTKTGFIPDTAHRWVTTPNGTPIRTTCCVASVPSIRMGMTVQWSSRINARIPGIGCGMVSTAEEEHTERVCAGTFRNTLTPDKKHACFFRPATEQQGLAGTIVSSLRHSRINMTIANTSNVTDLSSVRVEFYAR